MTNSIRIRFVVLVLSLLALLIPAIMFAQVKEPKQPKSPHAPSVPHSPRKPHHEGDDTSSNPVKVTLPHAPRPVDLSQLNSLFGTSSSSSSSTASSSGTPSTTSTTSSATTTSSQSTWSDSGAVTFRFDDGIADQYQNAAPVLQSDGFKATFYIITHQVADNGFAGYMSIDQVKDLFSRGFEIGAHTQTHPHLPTLSTSQQQSEIDGSKSDLESWGVGSITTFDYPYGEYDQNTMQLVKNAGFNSAVSVIRGFVTKASDPYQLEEQEAGSSVPLTQYEQWIDQAAANHQWVILTFHDVKDGGDSYSVTPQMFDDIVNYVKQKGIPVITVSQGVEKL
jgi:peptidoglycan/xylan/chitin deacetylase (PgdA/CDA1 family)